jgi:hypothetical protein
MASVEPSQIAGQIPARTAPAMLKDLVGRRRRELHGLETLLSLAEKMTVGSDEELALRNLLRSQSPSL